MLAEGAHIEFLEAFPVLLNPGQQVEALLVGVAQLVCFEGEGFTHAVFNLLDGVDQRFGFATDVLKFCEVVIHLLGEPVDESDHGAHRA